MISVIYENKQQITELNPLAPAGRESSRLNVVNYGYERGVQTVKIPLYIQDIKISINRFWIARKFVLRYCLEQFSKLSEWRELVLFVMSFWKDRKSSDQRRFSSYSESNLYFFMMLGKYTNLLYDTNHSLFTIHYSL